MINDAFTTPELAAAWQLWEDYRKERKLPKYKPIGLKQTVSRLSEITGGDQQKAVAFIHYSIAQNYQGIFPDPKYQSNGTKGTHFKNIRTGQDELSASLQNGLREVYGG